jgi:hypothetical protein
MHTEFWCGNVKKNPLGRQRRKLEYNIQTDFTEVGRKGMGCINLAQDRDKWRAIVNTLMTFRVPQNAGNFFTGWGTISFSRWTSFHAVS